MSASTAHVVAFVNGARVEVPSGTTVVDAVAVADAGAAAAVRAGTMSVVDSRGIAVAADHVVSGGYVMRLVPVRA
ncbi:MAG TPA: hypothetical protein VFM71_10940 [Gemmatimonadaceae bacterium]|nr:hypothetical protein [Gemmatimonadaceae bacterium]